MSDILVTSPYQPFTLPNQFKAVFNGYIYCGTVDAVDPSVSQVQVYLVNESGDKAPVAQPLRTNAGGFLVYNGQPAKFVTNSNHSLLVRDSLGNQLWYAPDVSKADPDAIAIIIGSQARESLRRSYAEAGRILVDGSFDGGAILTSSNSVALYPSNGKAYSHPGPYPHTVTAGTDPTVVGGYVDRSYSIALQFAAPYMFGAVAGQDATVAIQAALDDPRPITLITENYFVNAETRLHVPSNKIVKFVNGSSLTALPATSQYYSIFNVENKENIHFIKPKLIGDRDTHLGSGGESGFGIRCLSSKGISVTGGDISKMWGDGLYFGAFDSATHSNCEDITVRDTNCHHNRRQGMSLTGVIGAYVENSKFNDTNGTNPQSGLDIEPNAGFACKDLTFVNCEADRNAGAGFEALDALNSGNVENITFINCQARGNGSNGLRLVSARDVTHTGEISGNTSHGVYAIQGSTNLRLPSPNIHNNGGDGVQTLTNSAGTIIGSGKIYGNSGFGVQASYKINLDNVEINNNVMGGWYFGTAAIGSKAVNCHVHDNGGTGGETAAADTKVVGGEYSANSTTTNATGHNLAIYASDCTVTGGVKSRVGTNANKPAYGLRTTSNSNIVCKGNDFRGSGVTGDILQLTLTNPDISDNFPYRRSGTTAQRPTNYLEVGMQYYDQTLSKPIWYLGGASPWRDAAGVVV